MQSRHALLISCSTMSDGSMKSLSEEQSVTTFHTRQTFLATHNITMADTTLVRLVYEGTNYCRYATLSDQDKGDGMIRPSHFTLDGAVVTNPGHALFLPLADCIGAVIYDATKGIMMLSHLGRHNLEQYGATRSIEYLVREHGVDPKYLTVWLSPAAGKDYYPLFAFDNRSLHEVATEQLITADIQQKNITTTPIDSAADKNYYSHSEFLKSHRDDDGRFAVVAMMQ